MWTVSYFPVYDNLSRWSTKRNNCIIFMWKISFLIAYGILQYVFTRKLKVSDEYASNISRGVNLKEHKLSNLKSYDGHILIYDILPLALRGIMPNNVIATISEVCLWCLKSYVPKLLVQLNLMIAISGCFSTLEKIFPHRVTYGYSSSNYLSTL